MRDCTASDEHGLPRNRNLEGRQGLPLEMRGGKIKRRAVHDPIPAQRASCVSAHAPHDRRQRALGDLFPLLSGLPALMLAIRSTCSWTYGLGDSFAVAYGFAPLM